MYLSFSFIIGVKNEKVIISFSVVYVSVRQSWNINLQFCFFEGGKNKTSQFSEPTNIQNQLKDKNCKIFSLRINKMNLKTCYGQNTLCSIYFTWFCIISLITNLFLFYSYTTNDKFKQILYILGRGNATTLPRRYCSYQLRWWIQYFMFVEISFFFILKTFSFTYNNQGYKKIN